MVTKFVKEECVEEVPIGNVVIMLLLYADDVLLANALGDAQKLMKALEVFRKLLVRHETIDLDSIFQ